MNEFLNLSKIKLSKSREKAAIHTLKAEAALFWAAEDLHHMSQTGTRLDRKVSVWIGNLLKEYNDIVLEPQRRKVSSFTAPERSIS